MSVNIGLIILTWIAFRLEKKNINVLGFLPLPKRFYQFLFGFALTAILSVLVNIFFAQRANFEWIRNQNFTIDHILNGSYNTFNSVAYEELIFRGYVLYKLLQLLGEKKAVIITSIAFGIYHWFTFGAWGNYPMMIWVFVTTGLWGLMFAYCYTRTGTILLATGLHWGWNFCDQIVFNQKGDGLLKPILSDKTTYLNQFDSFLITTLPTIVFAVTIILYLIKAHEAQTTKEKVS
jgi:membrane protease YdiL (CAAX protease family)